MNKKLWLMLRILGAIAVVVLLMTGANAFGFFVRGVGDPFWLFALGIIVLAIVLLWTYRVVWKSQNPVRSPRWWSGLQWVAALAIVGVIGYVWWQGALDERMISSGPIALAYHLSSAAMQLAFAVAFLLLVTILRFLVGRNRAAGAR